MTVWDLSRLRYTVRKITGKFDETQLPSNSPGAGLVTVDNPPGIDDYINDFYMYDFPEHLRTLKLKDFFTFTTIPNVGTYNIPQTIYQLEPPIYIDNYQFAWYQSPDAFYRIWPELNFIDQAIAVGDNFSNTFTFTLSQTTIQQGTVVIGCQPNIDGTPSPQLETFTDVDTPALLDQPTQIRFTNPGTLTGNLGGTGTIDYLTGLVTVNFANAVPTGVNINAHYHPYQASRPRDILFFQQQLFLRPIPNDTYLVKVVAYQMPTAVISSATNATQAPLMDSTGNLIGAFNGATSLTTLPEFNEWWQLLAYGAALKIFIEDGDHEEFERNKVYFEEQKMLAQRKALKQLANQRIPTAYAQNVSGDASGSPLFPYYF